MDTVDDLQQELMKVLDSLGTYKTEQKKNSVHAVRERAFIGIHPKKSYLGVNVVLDRSKASPPRKQSGQGLCEQISSLLQNNEQATVGQFIRRIAERGL